MANYPITPPIGEDPVTWIANVFNDPTMFLMFKHKNHLFPPGTVSGIIPLVNKETGAEGKYLQVSYPDSYPLTEAQKKVIRSPPYAGLYSVLDVLCGVVGPLKPVSQVNQNINVVETRIYPVVAYEELRPGVMGAPILSQLGDYTVALLDDLTTLELAVQVRNMGYPDTSKVGQVSGLNPPGYPSTLIENAPYVVSWTKDEGGNVTLKYSDGTLQVLNKTTATANASYANITLLDTVSSVVVDPDGNNNTSTTSIIPLLTTDTGVITASSFEVGNEPWKIASINTPGGWWTTQTENQWVIYDAGTGGAVVNKFNFSAHPDIPNCSPKKFIFQGSMDKKTWIDLFSTYKNVAYRKLVAAEQSDWFTFYNGTSYEYYRLYILESYGV